MAITTLDVEIALKPVIEPSPYIDGEKMIVLSGGGGVHVSTFVSLFATAVDMTAASLHAVDGGTLGYDSHIDDWKTKGYIL